MVHFEEDPDGDGFYQIQHTYKDRVGVWGVPSTGRSRVMYEVAPDTMVTIHYIVFYSTLASALPESAMVDLVLFAEFAQAYGSTLTQFQDGTVTFESPGGDWYYVEHPDTTSVEP